MYITTRNGGKDGQYKYVVLIEKVWDSATQQAKSVTVKKFGRLDQMKPGEYEALKAKYKQESADKAAATQAMRREAAETVLAIQSSGDGKRRKSSCLNYGYYALKSIWDDLRLPAKIGYLQKKAGIKVDLNAVVSFLVYRKVLDPASILRSFVKKDSYLGNPAGKDDLSDYYDTYDFLAENKETILKHVNKRMDEMFGKDRAKLLFYDVTNAYFESPLTDEERGLEQKSYAERFEKAARMLRDSGEVNPDCWREDGTLDFSRLPEEVVSKIDALKLRYVKARGPSKEHRTDCPIVSIVMAIDKFGFPMDFEVYSGNASEFKTMRPTITEWQQQYNIKEAVIVADRGINSAENLEMLRSLGLGFLVAQKVTQFSAAMEKKLLEDEKYRPINPEEPELGRFRVVRNWTKGSGEKAVKCTLVMTWNEKRAKRDNAILDALVALIEKKMERGDKVGRSRGAWAQLVKTAEDVEQPILGVDEEVLARRRRLAGYSAIVYSAPESEEEAALRRLDEEIDDDTMPFPMLGTYRKLTEIENCFRIMKSNLGLRPMYVYKEHIRGHVFVVFMALILARLVQDRLTKAGTPLSINRICEALRNAEVAVKYNPATDSYLYLPITRQGTGREDAPWDSEERFIEKLRSGEVSCQDDCDTILKACGLSPVPDLCSRAELARCLRTRFPTDAEAIPEPIRVLDRKACLCS